MAGGDDLHRARVVGHCRHALLERAGRASRTPSHADPGTAGAWRVPMASGPHHERLAADRHPGAAGRLGRLHRRGAGLCHRRVVWRESRTGSRPPAIGHRHRLHAGPRLRWPVGGPLRIRLALPDRRADLPGLRGSRPESAQGHAGTRCTSGHRDHQTHHLAHLVAGPTGGDRPHPGSKDDAAAVLRAVSERSAARAFLAQRRKLRRKRLDAGPVRPMVGAPMHTPARPTRLAMPGTRLLGQRAHALLDGAGSRHHHVHRHTPALGPMARRAPASGLRPDRTYLPQRLSRNRPGPGQQRRQSRCPGWVRLGRRRHVMGQPALGLLAGRAALCRRRVERALPAPTTRLPAATPDFPDPPATPSSSHIKDPP